MKPIESWADVALVAQTIIQFVGFPFVIWQVWELQKSLHSTTHSNIYTHYTDTIRWFLDKPHLYPYFRENRLLVGSVEPSAMPVRSAEVLTLCELTTTLFEHATLEKENMPSTTWENCWLPYIRASYKRSDEMVDFFKKNRSFYVPEFQELIERVILPKAEPEFNADRK
jgi:hypothetical protein